MLKSKRRIRRKKRAIHWKLVLWLFVIINISLGLMFSPITSVYKARVIGARSEDEARIAQHLQSIRKTPYFRLNSKRLETLILANDEIKSIDTKTNIFGRAFLKIENRKRVAKVSGYVAQFLCDQGVVFSSTLKDRSLLILEIPEALTKQNFSLCGLWESKKTAEICEKISRYPQFKDWNMELNARGVICLKKLEEPLLILGTHNNFEQKMKLLVSCFDQQGDRLKRMKTINVMSPKNPMFVPLSKQEKNPEIIPIKNEPI